MATIAPEPQRDARLRPLRRVLALLARAAEVTLFPPRCPGCDAPGETDLCAACLAAIAPAGPRCHRCGAPRAGSLACAACRGRTIAVERVVVIGPYAGTLRTMIRGLKYGGREALARPIGAVLGDRLAASRLHVDVVVPVPLQVSRERERGYNQAALIAEEVARRLALPLAPGALRRVRRTPALYGLGAAERAEAIAGAFAVLDPAPLAGKRVLLVDDILTTGATISACADACRAAGAVRVFAACAARDV